MLELPLQERMIGQLLIIIKKLIGAILIKWKSDCGRLMLGKSLNIIFRPSENSKELIIDDICRLATNGKTVLDINSYASSRFNLPELVDISEKIYVKLIYRDFTRELSLSKIDFKYLNWKSQTLEIDSGLPPITSFSDQSKIVIDPFDVFGISVGEVCSAIFMHLMENDAGEVYVQGKIRIRIPGLVDSILFSILFKKNLIL